MHAVLFQGSEDPQAVTGLDSRMRGNDGSGDKRGNDGAKDQALVTFDALTCEDNVNILIRRMCVICVLYVTGH
jgi:hypothetical protein